MREHRVQTVLSVGPLPGLGLSSLSWTDQSNKRSDYAFNKGLLDFEHLQVPLLRGLTELTPDAWIHPRGFDRIAASWSSLTLKLFFQ